MSYVDKRVEDYREQGVFAAERAERDIISEIINMPQESYYDIEIVELESYLSILAQHVQYVQQQYNITKAREIDLGNDFKREAIPRVLNSKIRSVEERYIYASTLSDELSDKYVAWQQAIIDATLMKEMADPVKERLQVLKRLYDDRRYQGENKYIHKYQNQ